MIGGYSGGDSTEASLMDTLAHRRSILWRLEEKSLEKVYESDGWAHAVHHADGHWFAVVAAKTASGTGSDYRLITSYDRGRTWNTVGKIPAISISQILAVNSTLIYVFGANTFLETEDSGKSWNMLSYPEVTEGKGFKGCISKDKDGKIYAFSAGLMELQPETKSWKSILPGYKDVEAVSDTYFTAVVNKKLKLFRKKHQDVTEISELPYKRLPVKITDEDKTVRILTHPRAPEELGFFKGGLDRKLLRSDNGGRSWKTIGLRSIQIADISGANAGVGVDIKKRVFTTIVGKK